MPESLFFNKVAGLVKFAKFLRTPFLREYLRWLLLNEASVDTWCVFQILVKSNKEGVLVLT